MASNEIVQSSAVEAGRTQRKLEISKRLNLVYTLLLPYVCSVPGLETYVSSNECVYTCWITIKLFKIF